MLFQKKCPCWKDVKGRLNPHSNLLHILFFQPKQSGIEAKLMPTITKKDFVNRIAEATQCKQMVVKAVVQHFLDEVSSELAKGNRLEFRDFGVFEAKDQRARTAQNPKTLEPVDVPAKRTVKFKMGRRMRDGMNAERIDE
jgi:nucleoid DNA-binding protein